MAGHAGEEEAVKGHAEQPIQPPPEAARAEGRGLDEAGFLDAEFQPGFAGEFHFGKEHEAALGPVDEEHAPEVDGITGAQVDGVASSAPNACSVPLLVGQER